MFLGKHDATPLKSGTIVYSEIRKALVKDSAVTLPVLPSNFGQAMEFAGSSWLMLGNGPDDTVFPGFRGCGDCAWAGPAHEIMESHKSSEKPVPSFSGKTVVDQYSNYSGFDAQTGSGDSGSNMQEVMVWRQTKGIYDDMGVTHKIGNYWALTPGNLQELWEMVWLTGRAAVGVQLQQAQETQFPSTWNYVAGGPIAGGHYVPIMGKHGLVSWARRVGFTNKWYINCNDETYGYNDDEEYNSITGENVDHFSSQDVEKYAVLLARAKSAI